ncbi:hypothetical protein JQX13_11660 [Archangium violaceum]|uniref:hypothetical protein n=1 Tax=Archangium violaceum TaxID=83451 RepID=UPI00193B9F7F|nr:hypothetical protein [Archangium violaceum]QRK10668.1 hypothetical protein JQX13_11660 [Archangium violaceum]
MQSLARLVEGRTQRLAETSVSGLYEDPFWFARYGEDRARRFGGEDAVFHVRYLVQALEYVRAAESALEWPEGPARAVHEARSALVRQTLHMLSAREGPPTPEQARRLEEELLLQLSYLMDALGTKRPGLFVEHVRWYAGFWPNRELRYTYRGLLEALESALAQEASVSELPRATVATGRTALEKEHS